MPVFLFCFALQNDKQSKMMNVLGYVDNIFQNVKKCYSGQSLDTGLNSKRKILSARWNLGVKSVYTQAGFGPLSRLVGVVPSMHISVL
jgi:hypothetical protein